MKTVNLVPFTVVLAAVAGLHCAPTGAQTTVRGTPSATALPVGDVLYVDAVVQSEHEDIEPVIGDMKCFTLQTAQRGGTSYSVSMRSGTGMQPVVERSYQTRFRLVFTAVKEGDEYFDMISFRSGGQEIKMEPFTVRVLPPISGHRSAESSAPPAHDTQADAAVKRGLNYFIVVQPSKDEAFVGEQIEARFLLYSRHNVVQYDGNTLANNTLQGVHQVEIPIQVRDGRTERVRGVTYLVYELRRVFLFPFRSGELTMEQRHVPVLLQTGGGFFANRFQENVPVLPLTLRVKALPEEGRPPAFNGAVGKYDIRAEVDNASPTVGGTFLLRVTVYGYGNIKEIPAPPLPELPDVRRSREMSSEQSEVREEGVYGAATFEYALSPLKEGALTIPPITFAFLNPESGRYETRVTQPIQLDVQPQISAPMDNAVVLQGGGLERTVIELETVDFRHIATTLRGGINQGTLLYQTAVFWLLLLGPLGLLLCSLHYTREQQRLAVDAAYARRRGASKAARAALETARRAQASGNADTFYGAVSRGLLGFLRDHLHIEALGMTRDQLRDALGATRADAALADETIQFLAELDRLRFAGEQATTRGDVLTRAGNLIGRWERVK